MIQDFIKGSFRIAHALLDAPDIPDVVDKKQSMIKALLTNTRQLDKHQQLLHTIKNQLLQEYASSTLGLNGQFHPMIRPDVLADAILSLYESSDLYSVLMKLEWINSLLAETGRVIFHDARSQYEKVQINLLTQLQSIIVIGFWGLMMTIYAEQQAQENSVPTWLMYLNFSLFMVFTAQLFSAGMSYTKRSLLDKKVAVFKSINQTYSAIEESIIDLLVAEKYGKKFKAKNLDTKLYKDYERPVKFVFFPNKELVTDSVRHESPGVENLYNF